MLAPTEEPFVEPVAANDLGFQLPSAELFAPFDDEPPVGWDTTNDVFGQTLLGTLPSGSQLGLNIAVYPDLSANKDDDGGNDGRGGSSGEDLGLRLPSLERGRLETEDTRVPLGNGSRHGSNDKLDGEEDGSPRGSSKSQQTRVGIPLGGKLQATTGAFGKTEAPAPWQSSQMLQTFQDAQKMRAETRRLKARNVNVPRSPRPVRTRSLPKRLADSNMATQLPSTNFLTYTSALGVKPRAYQTPGCHSQNPQQVTSADQVSSGPSSTAGNSAQSHNNPVGARILTVCGSKRKLTTRSTSPVLNDPVTYQQTSVAVSSKQQGSTRMIRATSTRTESRGKPSFSDLVSCGVMAPGMHTFYVGQAPIMAEVCNDGAIVYEGTRYRAVSKFALTVLRMRNPARQSCDGWKEVSWNGDKLDKLRAHVAEFMRTGHFPTIEPQLSDHGILPLE